MCRSDGVPLPVPRFHGDEQEHLLRVEIHLIIWGIFLMEANMDRSHISSAGRGGGMHTQQNNRGGFVATVADQTTHWTFVASAAPRWRLDRRADGEEEFLPNFP